MTTKFDLPSFLKNLTTQAGVYQMYDKHDKVLYVGKARNLKKRVNSYFHRQDPSPKTRHLVDKITYITCTVTQSENEALLLESNLIKKLKPPYNILLRDDKSYPYIVVTKNHDFPRVDLHRGKKQEGCVYYGPYPSVRAARESLHLLQKLFRIRQCQDSFFKSRRRPCLQYQIKRCTAPCVAYIDKASYQEAIRYAELFLSGKNQQIMDDLIKEMEKSSEALAFEEAARIRDKIASLRQVQEQQYITTDVGDVDVVAVVCKQNVACVSVLGIRSGRVLGTHVYFPEMPEDTLVEEVQEAFLSQYYLNKIRLHHLPEEIIVSKRLTDKKWLEECLSEQKGSAVILKENVRGQRKKWLDMSMNNASEALKSQLVDQAAMFHRFCALQKALGLSSIPERIECFDISHSVGEATVASCIVFNIEGALKDAYRRFNIQDITPGDDYAAMYQALTRHYARLKDHDEQLPDVLLIDGGKGQLRQASSALEELQISGVILVAVAKGAERKPGAETLFFSGQKEGVHLSSDNLGLHLIQQIRDEAHRFAITGHRQQRNKKRKVSYLENIPGIGKKRRQQLLTRFGGLQALRSASIAEISRVPGISLQLAKSIYEYLHE